MTTEEPRAGHFEKHAEEILRRAIPEAYELMKNTPPEKSCLANYHEGESPEDTIFF